jgi:hypothetical protein
MIDQKIGVVIVTMKINIFDGEIANRISIKEISLKTFYVTLKSTIPNLKQLTNGYRTPESVSHLPLIHETCGN